MKVLIADDDVSVRGLLRRLVTSSSHVDAIEVADGAAAMDVLLREHIDLLITDLSMPVMGGLETLEAVRGSRKFASLPVVVMTGQPDEQDFLRAQSLGILGFLVKPFSASELRGRLDPILRSLRVRDSPGDLEPSVLTIKPTDRILLVDQSTEFLGLAETVLGRLGHVEIPRHEFAAIRACVDSTPDLVLIGATSDLITMPALATKVRGLTKRTGLRLIAAVGSGDLAAAREHGHFDAFVVRSLLPRTFETSLRQILDDPTRARLLLHPASSWLAENLEANGRKVGERAGVAPSVHTGRTGIDEAVRWIASDVEIQCAHFGWVLRVRCPLDLALQMSRIHHQTPADDVVSEQVAVQTMSALAEDLAKHWCQRAGEERLSCTANAPVTQIQGCLGSGPDVTVPLHSRRWLSHQGREIAILETIPLTGTVA